MKIIRKVIAWFNHTNETPIPMSRSAIKPWKRPHYAENMKPFKGWNFEATFCRACGDWITDSAYYTEHRQGHSPLRGSWNYENPNNKRRDPDDIQPVHEEWLNEIREQLQKEMNESIALSMSWGPPQPGVARSFHSEKEARAILEPYGFAYSFSPNAGFSSDGVHWSGAWSVHTTERFRELKAQMEVRRNIEATLGA